MQPRKLFTTAYIWREALEDDSPFSRLQELSSDLLILLTRGLNVIQVILSVDLSHRAEYS